MTCPLCKSPAPCRITAPVDCGERSFTDGWGDVPERLRVIRERKYVCRECNHAFLTIEAQVGQYSTRPHKRRGR